MHTSLLACLPQAVCDNFGVGTTLNLSRLAILSDFDSGQLGQVDGDAILHLLQSDCGTMEAIIS